MKITFITLFENYINVFKEHSIVKNAIKKGLVEIEIINPRDFAENNKVDDTVYGGGAGMLLMIEPIVKAIRSIKTHDSKVFLLSPRGQVHDQPNAKKLSKEKHIILISGHYEGVDARIKHYIDEEISIGEFIVTGGELPSMLVADSIVRLVEGVIKSESHEKESFENDMLEWDNFTKPVDFEGHIVPEVLLNGNHKEADKWKRTNATKNTVKHILENKKG